ncbi:MAG: alanine racemase [Terriglobia bacterium]
MLPQLTIDLAKVEHNTRAVVRACEAVGVRPIGVTKGCLGEPKVAWAMLKGGVSGVGDSRLQNLAKLKRLDIPFLMLLRQPMTGEYEQAVKLADMSMVSEFRAAVELAAAARSAEMVHSIMLMVETGDLREGVPADGVNDLVERILGLEGVRLGGVGTNVACSDQPVSARDSLVKLAETAIGIEQTFDVELDYVSGGNSSGWEAVVKKEVPLRIDQLRIGEAILLGRETVDFEPIGDSYQDAFVLSAEVLEVAEKPRIEGGYAQKVRQAVLALGKQDLGGGRVVPTDHESRCSRVTSDHIVLDLGAGVRPRPGETYQFLPDYYGLMAAMTSPYVSKNFLD